MIDQIGRLRGQFRIVAAPPRQRRLDPLFAHLLRGSRGAFGERHIHKLAFDRTPAFNPASPKHVAVVDAAKALLGDWAARRTQIDIVPFLSPEKHMITRRKKVRAALEALSTWGEYAEAAAAIYAA